MQGSRHFAFALAVAITLVVAAPGAVPASASASRTVAAVQAHPSREVFGFALASSLADPSIGYPSWNFNLLSTVAFFGLHVNGSGQLVGDAGWNRWNSSALSNLVSVAHQHGTKVVLTVVLQDFSPNTPTMCSGLQHADTTVAQTVTEVRAKGVDGVNIDYEGLDGSCGTADPYWAQHALTAFAAKMRAALGSSYYLSIDTYASSASDGYGFFDVAGLAAYVDSFFVMAYDLEYSNYSRPPASCPTFCLGPTAPLAGYYYNDTAVVSQYLAVVGAGKVILGVPYYGRKACVGAAVPNAFPTSSVVADSYLDASGEATDPAVQPGSFVSHRDANSSGLERWDTWYNTNLHCTRELYWDDAVSLGKKYDLINANRLRGAGIWNLNYGGRAPELWAALAGHFSACTSVAVSASPASPQLARAQVVTFTATSTGCTSPLYQYWLWSGAAWQVVRAYSASATFTWSTSGVPAGTYTFGVWVRDSGSSGIVNSVLGSVDAFTSTQFKLTPFCASVTGSVAPPSPVATGTTLTMTGAAAGCANPLYAFWVLPPGASAWQLARAYSASPTFTWATAGKAPGAYRFGVWALDGGSSGVLSTPMGGVDAYAAMQTTLFNPCSSVSATSPAAAVVSGGTATFTAKATGCPSPLYEFWVRQATSGAWQLAQAYSANPTLQWSPAGKTPGAYYIGVWARDAAGNGVISTVLGRADAFGSRLINVYTPCAKAALASSPASPIAHGTGAHVTFSASASGCSDPNPLYEFWLFNGTSWQVVQGWSTRSTFDWNTGGLPAGTWRFGVWVRDAASAGVVDGGAMGRYDAYAPGAFTLT